MLHSEFAARLATSGMELRLVLAAGVPAEKRRRAAACPGMSYLWQSMIMLHMTPHQTFTFGRLAHVPWGCAVAVISISERYACLQHQVHEKWPLRKTWCLSESFGLCRCQACHRQNCVLWFQLLQNLHLVRIETQPLSEILLHSCSWHLQFPWGPMMWLPWTSDERHKDVLYLLIGDTLSAS
jgi:hypothetical protein